MSPQEIVEVTGRQRRATRWLRAATVVATVLAIPGAWAVFRLIQWGGNPYAWPFTWSWEVVRRSLVDGSFWSQPLAAIFQTPSLRIGDAWGEIAASYGVVAIVVYFFAWLLHGLPMLVAIASLGRGVTGMIPGRARGDRPGRMAALLVPALAQSIGRQLELPGEPVQPRVHNLGGDVILTVGLDRDLPEAIIDSRGNRVERRSGIRLILPSASEVVLDGITHETSRIYVADDARESSTVLFSPAVTAVVVKQLPRADVLIDTRTLTAVLDVEDVTDERRLEELAVGVLRLAEELVTQAGRLRALRRRDLTGGLEVRDERGILRWRPWTRLTRLPATGILVAALAAVATVLSVLGGRGGSTSELIAFAAVLGALLVHGVGRRIRAMLSFDARPGSEEDVE